MQPVAAKDIVRHLGAIGIDAVDCSYFETGINFQTGEIFGQVEQFRVFEICDLDEYFDNDEIFARFEYICNEINKYAGKRVKYSEKGYFHV